MDITTEEAIAVNKQFGGHLRSDSSIRFAEAHTKKMKSTYRKAALWVRAIAVGHPFSDANKRTTLYVIGRFVEVRDEMQMAKTVISIAKKNVIDIDKIVEALKNNNRRKNVR